MAFRSWSGVAVLAGILWGLSACSSPVKRGREAMEKGLYDNAIVQFELALAKDKNDTDAREGLQKARAAWVDQRLIDVRRARIAGNSEQALDLLIDILQKQRSWGTAAAGKAVFTQREEAGFASDYVRGKVLDDVHGGVPLRAAHTLRRAEIVFSDEFKPEFSRLQAATQSGGKNLCAKLRKERSARLPYFAHFVGDVCRFFGQTQGLPVAKLADEVAYYGGLLLDGKLDGVSAPETAWMKESLLQVMQSTAWFDARVKRPLAFKLTGQFTQDRTAEPVALSHVYKVQESYTEYVKVQKPRSEPYTVQRTIADASGTRTVDVTEYRTVYDSVTEPQIRYRDVEKVYHYRGVKRQQRLSLHVSGSGRLLDDAVEAAHQANADQSGIDHDENQRSIGLSPSHANLADPGAWFKTETAKWVDLVRTRLVDGWVRAYCTPGSGPSGLAELGNRVQRCLRQKTETYPAFADAWYQSNFGLNTSQAVSLLASR